MLEQLNATIGKIYAAAAGSSRWQDALISIEDLTHSAGAVIDLVPTADGVASKTLAGSFTEENCADYARDYQAICPRIRRAVEHPEDSIQFDYLFMTEAEMDRNAVYDWFGRHGLRYYVGGVIGQTRRYLGYFSVQRTRRQGHASAKDVALIELLKPHLERALSLADQLGTLRSHQTVGSTILNGLQQAVFALNSNARILFTNDSARRLIAADDGLAIEARHLNAALPVDQGQLVCSIRCALSPIGNSGRAWTRVSRPSGRPPFALFVAPLNVADELLTAAGAKVLVLVHDTGEHRCASVDMLISLFGLTETEARLASALSGGHSLESASALLHMQLATARCHLKSIFRKTNVNRQQDLVRRLTSLSSLSTPSDGS